MSSGNTFRCPDCDFLLYVKHPTASHGCDKRNVIARLRALLRRVLDEGLTPALKQEIEKEVGDAHPVVEV